MRKNRLRELIKNALPSIGTRVLSPWPGIVEIIGHTGEIDYVEFLGQYASWDLHDLDNFARAAELFPMSS
ncbi:MAG: 2,4-dihydroxyhept-2-ene-1,7-dioic acid aldolase, partial [Desulfatiglandales bacterium]